MASWLHRVQDGFDTVMTALESSLHWRPSALPRDGSAESKEEPSLPEPAAILAPESDSLPPPSFNLLSVPLIRTVSGMPLCKVCRVPAGCCAHTDLELVEERRGLQLEDASSSCSSSSSSSVTMSRVDSDSAGQETLRRRGSGGFGVITSSPFVLFWWHLSSALLRCILQMSPSSSSTLRNRSTRSNSKNSRPSADAAGPLPRVGKTKMSQTERKAKNRSKGGGRNRRGGGSEG